MSRALVVIVWLAVMVCYAMALDKAPACPPDKPNARWLYDRWSVATCASTATWALACSPDGVTCEHRLQTSCPQTAFRPICLSDADLKEALKR